MTTPQQNNTSDGLPETPVQAPESVSALVVLKDAADIARRRMLMIVLTTCVVGTGFFGYLFVRYVMNPEPLPDMLKVPVNVNYAPHYLFSIYGVNGPVGVGLSPDGKKLYVTETGGKRLVKIIAPDNGAILKEFMPPLTQVGERAPAYIAVDANGRVFVTDRLQHAIFIYDADGNYQDTLLGANTSQISTAPDQDAWSPLGISIASDGKVLVTNVAKEHNSVLVYAGSIQGAGSSMAFSSAPATFGASGTADGQFLFPNDALVDSKGRFYVIDGNNSRITVWDSSHHFLYFFGTGTGDGAINLPRGAYLDSKDRLFVVDAVGQNVKVYNVSGDQPVFMYSFGEMGVEDGQFNYPNDIALSGIGQLYIADRDNNRIQVWSY